MDISLDYMYTQGKFDTQESLWILSSYQSSEWLVISTAYSMYSTSKCHLLSCKRHISWVNIFFLSQVRKRSTHVHSPALSLSLLPNDVWIKYKWNCLVYFYSLRMTESSRHPWSQKMKYNTKWVRLHLICSNKISYSMWFTFPASANLHVIALQRQTARSLIFFSSTRLNLHHTKVKAKWESSWVVLAA